MCSICLSVSSCLLNNFALNSVNDGYLQIGGTLVKSIVHSNLNAIVFTDIYPNIINIHALEFMAPPYMHHECDVF